MAVEKSIMSYILHYKDKGVAVADVFLSEDMTEVNEITTEALQAKREGWADSS